MKLSDKAIETINKIHLMSGESKESVRTVFESLITLILLNSLENETTTIPLLGDITLENNVDRLSEIKVSNIDSVLEKSYYQMYNKQESLIEKMFKSKITSTLEKYVNE